MWFEDGVGLQVLFFVASVVAGILVAYGFYRLQRKGATSAEGERLKRAHTEVIDVLEGYIINQQKLSEGAVVSLIAAAGREHAVNLWASCTPVSVLEDAALRIQRSRHLGVAPKTQYSAAIEGLIRSILEQREAAERPKTPLEMALKDLEYAIVTRDWNLVDRYQDQLKQSLKDSESRSARVGSARIQFGLSGFVGLLTTVTVFALGLNSFDSPLTLFWILVGVVGLVILSAVVFVLVSNLGATSSTQAGKDHPAGPKSDDANS